MFGLIVPYLAVISAGSCNVGFTRMDEIRNGIFVKDKDGKVVNPSPSPSPSPNPNKDKDGKVVG